MAVSPLVRKHDRLLNRRDFLTRWEKRVAVWIQLWILVVATIFGLKLWGVEQITWPMAATAAFGQTVLNALVILLSHGKWRAELGRRQAEQDAAAAMTAEGAG